MLINDDDDEVLLLYGQCQWFDLVVKSPVANRNVRGSNVHKIKLLCFWAEVIYFHGLRASDPEDIKLLIELENSWYCLIYFFIHSFDTNFLTYIITEDLVKESFF